ncbi:MAG: LPS assembly lipoprotein LptE [Kiritimatiellae bacterium]|nr:LPS assembly lipoprotein LptE [Kiritimatiellia bacterium]
MQMSRLAPLFLATALLAAAGCATYKFGSAVPEELRTIAVPVFENASGYPEIDAVVTQYVLREFQREGTFKIRSLDNASLKLLGKLVKTETQSLNYDRNYGSRTSEYRYTLVAEITLVERGTGKLLIDAMPVKANTTFLTHGDMLTGMQDAYPRIAKELARAITDAVLAQW